MKISVSAGKSQITIVNGTRRAVWVAIYKRSALRTNEPPIAWQVVSPPPRGKTEIFIPRDYEICARYSFEPENPRRPVYQTNVLKVLHAPAGAAFVIESVSADRRTWGAVLTRAAENPGWYQIRVFNRFSLGVWGHVRKDGRDIFPPRILPPMTVWTEDLSSSFYVAVLPLPHVAGDLLPDSETAMTEIAVKVGESVKVQGGPRKGFEISRIPEGTVTIVEEPEVWPDEQAPHTPEKKLKAQARPKTDVKKREVAKKPVKKAAPKASASTPEVKP